MERFYKKEEYIYMDCHFQMSNKVMADTLYAAIIAQAAFTTIWSLYAYDYDRKQNSRNGAVLKVHIHPEMISTFETISGQKLEKPESITINSP